jgi:hypothetical protein
VLILQAQQVQPIKVLTALMVDLHQAVAVVVQEQTAQSDLAQQAATAEMESHHLLLEVL